MIDLSLGFPPLLKGGAFFIDNSTFESVQACERQAYYRIVRQRQLKGQANPLNFGGAVHAALDTRYRHGGFAHESLNEQLTAGIGYLNENPTDDWRSSELLMQVVNGYNRTYPVEDFSILSSDGIPFVELPFAVPMGEVTLPAEILMPNLMLGDASGATAEECYRIALATGGQVELLPVKVIPIIWTGKIDLVVQRNGAYWIVDHKTSSQFGDSYWEQYKLSSQFMGYKWALEQTLDLRIEGTMVNVLAIRQPTKTGKGTTYHRQWMSTEYFLAPEWRNNTMSLLSDFFSCFDNDYFPQRYTSCRTKWHRNCQYLGVCTMNPNQREMYLNTGDFEDVTWSPLRED